MKQTVLKHCRVCGSENLFPLIDFGPMPLADRLVTPDTPPPDPLAPLAICACGNCRVVQLVETVDPAQLFDADYPYYSSVSPALCAHFADAAQVHREAYAIGPQHTVLEAASNDGYLLRHFKAVGARVLGIDPSHGPASVAEGLGIPTRRAFFDLALAKTLVSEGWECDLFLANNVLAHVPDAVDFVQGVAQVLTAKGTAVFELPYLVDLLTHGEFDTIYHQHVYYHSVYSLKTLFAKAGLHITRVQRTPVHGGSLRVWVRHVPEMDASVDDLLLLEQAHQLDRPTGYHLFIDQFERQKERLYAELLKLKQAGKRVVGYGAAAKATTLLASCGIGAELLDGVVDLNPAKHGLLMPGSRLPIAPVQRLRDDPPDYLLILAWNFAEEIMQQQADFAAAGGRFIIPIPDYKLI